MSYKNRKAHDSNRGFTIIEVLIVLAIAGLILLIVFLAVPALQRNSRNTAIKNDVQNVVGGVSEYQGANNGALPKSVTSDGSGSVTYKGSSTTGNETSIKIQGSTEVTTVTAAPTSAPEPGIVNVVLGKKCNSDDPNPRAVSAYYAIETSGDTVLQCTES
jgi:prepilin-type N-terminal cleavage/methylation domain-containing protein